MTKVSRIYDLDSSLSKIFIYPSKRKILYQNEVFYSTDGAVLWHKEKSTYAAGTDVEAGSSDERYFSIIIDLAFHGGNQIDFAKWEEGKERWMYLGEFESSKGGTKGIWFDTKLMSLNGNIVSTWIISEYYAEKEKVEKDCIKWSFDISGRKSKIERKRQKVSIPLCFFPPKVITWRAALTRQRCYQPDNLIFPKNLWLRTESAYPTN